jgi:hypothetical protein
VGYLHLVNSSKVSYRLDMDMDIILVLLELYLCFLRPLVQHRLVGELDLLFSQALSST